MSESLNRLTAQVPYLNWLGITFRLDEIGEPVARLPYSPHLIGNPVLPALHGGVTAALLEVTAIIALSWQGSQSRPSGDTVRLPRTINLTTDYLRSGRPEDAFAKAVINRSGRRYASVRVYAWQSDPERPFAEAIGHFLMPPPLQEGHDGR